MLEYLIYKAIQFLALTLPWRTLSWLAITIADWNFRLNHISRTAMISNLRVILGESATDDEVERVAKETFRNFGKYMVEFFRFARVGNRFLKKSVTTRGEEYLDEARSHGRGVVAVSAHLSNWELAGAKFASLGCSVSGIALEHKNRRIKRLFDRQRARMRVRTYSLTRGGRRCLEALQRNGVICLVADRDLTGTGIFVDYFGKPAKFPVGPARFSLASGAPLVPTFMVRQPDDTFELIFEAPIYPPHEGDKKELVRKLTSDCARACERYVKRYPEQFANFFPIWEEQP